MNTPNNTSFMQHYRVSAKDLMVPPKPKPKSLVSFLVRLLFLLVPFKSGFKSYRKACGGRWAPAKEFGYNNLTWRQVPTCPTRVFINYPDPHYRDTVRVWQRWYHAKHPNKLIPVSGEDFLRKIFETNFYNNFPCHSHTSGDDLKNGKCYCEVYDDATE